MRKILLMLLVFCWYVLSANAQQRIISGTVTSSVPDEGALIGVSVSVKQQVPIPTLMESTP
jgi:hypothetical protein